MTAPVYQAPSNVGGYCGRCGTPFGPGAGRFCRTCGNQVRSQPAVATNYTYPAVPSYSVPAAQHKLGRTGLAVAAFATLFVLVAAITAAAVSSKTTTNYCHFTCGPDVGPRLQGSTAYSNSQFGYRVEYESPPFSIGAKDANGVLFSANVGFMAVTAAKGTDVTGAIQKAIGGLSTSEFQDLQQVSSVVPGAEVGYVPSSGEAYTANLVPPSGGTGQTVSIVAMAATQGDLTISVLAIAPQDLSSVSQLPFGVQDGSLFDYEVSNTIWPGQQ